MCGYHLGQDHRDSLDDPVHRKGTAHAISPVPSVPPALFMEVDFFILRSQFSFYLIFFNRNGGIHPRITKQFRPELAQKVTDLTCARPRFFFILFSDMPNQSHRVRSRAIQLPNLETALAAHYAVV